MAMPRHHLLVFRITCGVMLAMAFAQCITAATALAMRFESTRKVQIVEKIIEKPVEIIREVPILPDPRPDTAKIEEIDRLPLPPPRDLSLPAISDPAVEKLVNEARAARFSQDPMRAITKLEEAKKLTPACPVTLYELGECHESMGIYDAAREFYYQVTSLGAGGAGILYAKASDKLANGFEQPLDKLNHIVLGRIRVFSDPDNTKGQRTILTIPVQSSPGESIDYNDISFQIQSFDVVGTNKNPEPSNPLYSEYKHQWANSVPDWKNGEELMHCTYTIKPLNQQDEHLFGERKYFGHVVTLVYKGEVIDQHAFPRMLAHRLNIREEAPIEMDQDLPPGYNPDNPLLPLANTQEGDFLPPLPDDPPPDDILPVPPEYQNIPTE